MSEQTSGGHEWVCRGCTGDFEGVPGLILHHEKTGAIQRFCDPCASVTQQAAGELVEHVTLEDVGVPVPKLNEWPKPSDIECANAVCGLPCVIFEIEKGSNVAKYLCAQQHHGPTVILASRKDDEWVFEAAPF